jgi:uncharacterized protein GlcG (DUF336 family)
MKHRLVLSACLAALACGSTCLAADPAALPGDIGRPFNGLPVPPGSPLPPLPSHPHAKSPPLSLVLEAAAAAVKACAGYHIGVGVVDSVGTPKLVYIPDGTEGFHAYTGLRKAYTALTFRMPTSQVGLLTKTDPAVVAKIAADPNLLSFAGGLPIKVGDQVIGAIGISGAEPSAKDEECGLAGINRIRDRLQ